MCVFHDSSSSICKPRNLVDVSPECVPICAKGMPFMHNFKQFEFGGLLGVLIAINLVLLGFRDNILAQNHSYNLFSAMFAISYRLSILGSDK